MQTNQRPIGINLNFNFRSVAKGDICFTSSFSFDPNHNCSTSSSDDIANDDQIEDLQHRQRDFRPHSRSSNSTRKTCICNGLSSDDEDDEGIGTDVLQSAKTSTVGDHESQIQDEEEENSMSTFNEELFANQERKRVKSAKSEMFPLALVSRLESGEEMAEVKKGSMSKSFRNYDPFSNIVAKSKDK